MNWTPLTMIRLDENGNYPAFAGTDSADSYPGSRYGASVVIDPTGSTKYLYMYGGYGFGRGVSGSKLVFT